MGNAPTAASYLYGGKILRVNLSNGRIWTEPTAKYAPEWIGASDLRQIREPMVKRLGQ